MNFTNKVALITGASRGIGRATAEEFAQRGANVIINYKNSREVAEKLAQDLSSKYKIKALAFQADISHDEDVKRLHEFVANEFGKLDILVNNAAIVSDKEFAERTLDDWRKTFETNVFAVFNVCKVFRKLLANDGAIVNVSSDSGLVAFDTTSIDYDSSKAAVNALTINLAKEFAPIRVNAVAPGWVETDMNRDLPADYIKEEKESILLERWAHPEEIAKIIAFLASDDASFVNAAVLVADGGRR